MIDVLSPFAKLLENLSLRSLLALLLLAAGVLAFERYTSSFQLSRIQKSAEILATLQQVDAAGVIRNPELAAMHQDLIRELRMTLNAPPLSLRLPRATSRPAPDNVILLKFFWGALPWILLSLVTVPAIIKREKDAGMSLMSMWVFAAIFGTIGALLPTHWPWLNVYLYPWGTFLGFCFLVVIFAVWFGGKRQAGPDSTAGVTSPPASMG